MSQLEKRKLLKSKIKSNIFTLVLLIPVL